MIQFFLKLKQAAGTFFHKLGVSADFVTFLGLVAAFAAGYCIWQGLFLWAAILTLTSGILDLLDGAIARASKITNPFGGIMDSSFDRYGDAVLFGGMIFFCASNGSMLYAALAFAALVGSFSVSYVRARAECEMESCRTGFWERGERIAFVCSGLFLNNLPVVLWVLGITVHATVLKRLLRAHRQLYSPDSLSKVEIGLSRSDLSYWARWVVLLGLLFFFKPGF